MAEQTQAGSEMGSEGSRRDSFPVQSGTAQDPSQWATPRQEGIPRHLEAQWQEYLKIAQYPISGCGTSQLPDMTSWDDLATFDRVGSDSFRETAVNLSESQRDARQRPSAKETRQQDNGKAILSASQPSLFSQETQEPWLQSSHNPPSNLPAVLRLGDNPRIFYLNTIIHPS
ncbi:hypothetical protein JD844_001703 [Phrynosoma platyrhinos]|uniref:Uncharacterized protein n=1 Tax=Phrynosoma platyrhinos TaxID=52577 RepID=A0ABQ7TAD2_PHRPL|nr:hypothetical protein JD844_001703 [Phrynosoma platyrhinos]